MANGVILCLPTTAPVTLSSPTDHRAGRIEFRTPRHSQATMVNITFDEFSNSITSCGFGAPSQDQYRGFMGALQYAGINSKREAAMFMAQLIHEAGGLQFKEEIAYKGCQSSPYDTSVGVPGKSYHGRGYIQLSHSYNYKAASQDILGNDSLIKNPELVAQNEDLAFKTAAWFWKTNVANAPGVQQGRFGCSTKAINGVIECQGKENPNRFNYYCKVMKSFGLSENPNPSW